jgi:hypothetical protein
MNWPFSEGPIRGRLALVKCRLVSLPNFPVGVNPVRLQRLVDAMLRFGLLKPKYADFKVKSIIGG